MVFKKVVGKIWKKEERFLLSYFLKRLKEKGLIKCGKVFLGGRGNGGGRGSKSILKSFGGKL